MSQQVKVLDAESKKRVCGIIRRLKNFTSLHQLLTGEVRPKTVREIVETRGGRSLRTVKGIQCQQTTVAVRKPDPQLFEQVTGSVPDNIWIQGLEQTVKYLHCCLAADEDDLEERLDEFYDDPTTKFLNGSWLGSKARQFAVSN